MTASPPPDGDPAPRMPHPYRIPAIVLGTVALLFAAVFVVGILLPSGWTAERSLRIDAPAETLYPFFARASAWSDWTPDPDSGVELFGPAEGPGSGRRWSDEFYGEGEFTVVSVTRPVEVAYEVAVEGGTIRIRGVVRLQPYGDATEIQWREEGDFGWNPLLGYLTRRMGDLQGDQMGASLATLRDLVESREPGTPGSDPEVRPALD